MLSLSAQTRACLLEANGQLGAQDFPDLDRMRDVSRAAAGSRALLSGKSLNLLLSEVGEGGKTLESRHRISVHTPHEVKMYFFLLV